jgi:small-conductance mechanosensitive channel
MADVVNESVGVLNEVGQSVNPWLSKIVITILILLIGLIIGKIAGTLIRRLLNEVRLDKHMRTTGFRFSLEKFIGNAVSYAIYVIAIIMSLNQLGLTKAILTIIMAIIFFVIAVSFLLAVKDFFPNLFSGMRIKFSGLFSEGDEIQIKEVKGKVLGIGFLETRLKTSFNEEIIIPNSLFNKRQVIIRKKAVKKNND